MARVAWDNVQIDQRGDLFEIGEGESVGAVRRQFGVMRAESANDTIDVVAASVDVLRSSYSNEYAYRRALAEQMRTRFTKIEGNEQELLAQSGELFEIRAQLDILPNDLSALATIEQLQDAQVDNESARTLISTTLRSEFDGDLVALEQNLSTEIDNTTGRVEAMYATRLQVDTDGTRYVGGWGLANDGQTVQAAFDVDLFSIGRLGTGKVQPFIVDTSTNNVYLRSAVIQDASITNAKITDLSADKIISGKFATAEAPSPRTEMSFDGGYFWWAGQGATTAANASAYVDEDGNFVGQNITARGDIEATSLKAGIAMVDTLSIQDNAVTVPIGYQYDSSTNQSNDSWTMMSQINVPAGTFSTTTPCALSFGFEHAFYVSTTLTADRLAQLYVQLLSNGAVVFDTTIRREIINASKRESADMSGVYSFSRKVNVGAAPATFELRAKFYTADGVSASPRAASNRFMTLIGLKK